MSLTKATYSMIDGAALNVRDFGAVGDGVADDTAAIQAAINYAKAHNTYNEPFNSTPRGGPAIYFPAGKYIIASSLTLQNINGFTFFGEGKEASMLIHTANSGSMFVLDQILFNVFSHLGFAAGTVSGSGGSAQIAVRASGARTTNLFNWLATGNNGDRFNTFREIKVYGGFARVWDVGGSVTHSETTITAAQFFDCDYVWYSDNVQSLNTYFNDCDAEFISESVFYYVAGGFLTVTGGSYINPKDTLTIAGTDTGVGTGNGQFIFNSVKWEMYQNIDPTKSPRILNSTSSAIALISFNNCSNNAGSPDPAKIFMSVVSAMRINIEACDFVGVVSTTPNAGYTGYLSFNNCRMVPTVTRNVDNGSAYKVTYNNCGSATTPILNVANVSDTSNRPFAYQKNSVRLRIVQSIASAGTTSLTFAVPSNVIFTDAILTLAKAGGVTMDVNVFTDAAKTAQLFTVATGTATANRIWNPAITYSGAAAAFISGNTIYVDLVSGGNAGLVDAVITLDYVSNG